MNSAPAAPNPLAALAHAQSADERAAILLRLIEAHPEGRLVIEAGAGSRALLNDIDLSRAALEARFPGLGETLRPVWWDAAAGRLNLRNASLRGAACVTPI